MRTACYAIQAASAICIGSLVGCSAVNKVYDITNVQAGQTISGVPFRLADKYRVRVFRLQKDGTYKEVYSESRSMPDQERIYAANFDAKMLSDHGFKVELNADNTLKTTSLKTAQKATESISALADEVITNRTAREERHAVDRTGATTQRSLEASAIELKGKADIAEAQLKAALADPSTTAVDRVSARATLELARKKAIDAAVEAGLPAPFAGS
ncbi:hypothetical protein PSH97_21800 [Pseudomonas cucumis]|uniref:Uncharacterized protein n=1 Tax=Pseudomonas cucumis TaxID=2954082 RepID=A0ABY9ETE7_9PSED|nr:hypothetical protein [Pseudomonas cucumis]WLG83709.1 hypothetical protein PSH97_21800 [Pseudomonas cucumis]